MQITMFKGLLPVNFPNDWFFDGKGELIKWAKGPKGEQLIWFAPEGHAFAFWLENGNEQKWSQLTEEEKEKANWKDEPHAVEPRSVVKMFGQSSKVLDLKRIYE